MCSVPYHLGQLQCTCTYSTWISLCIAEHTCTPDVVCTYVFIHAIHISFLLVLFSHSSSSPLVPPPPPPPHFPPPSSPTLSPAEASKYLLQYLAQCSGHAGRVDRVKDRLIQSNPVLEVCTTIQSFVYFTVLAKCTYTCIYMYMYMYC